MWPVDYSANLQSRQQWGEGEDGAPGLITRGTIHECSCIKPNRKAAPL